MRTIKKLNYKPQKGFHFLKNVPKGTFWKTRYMEGVKLNDSINPLVLVYEYNGNPENKQYYIGKHAIAGNTEIQIIIEGEDTNGWMVSN